MKKDEKSFQKPKHALYSIDFYLQEKKTTAINASAKQISLSMSLY
jgi:hypothetical protein